MQKFAVFGNPIKHSLSPLIHQLFAEQTGKHIEYIAKLVPIEQFETYIAHFFSTEGQGVNITTPFKERAYRLASQCTERAYAAEAVNTLQCLADGSLLGDNTDGIGLVSDLKRLKMLTPQCRVLLLGAGGATRGVLQPLLTEGCHVIVANRTMTKAQDLVQHFKQYGQITASSFEALPANSADLIIHATTLGLHQQTPPIPRDVLSPQVACYDMFYQAGETPFITWARQQGVQHCSDGLGMLVGQAAHSFLLWHNVMPDVTSVLQQLRKRVI